MRHDCSERERVGGQHHHRDRILNIVAEEGAEQTKIRNDVRKRDKARVGAYASVCMYVCMHVFIFVNIYIYIGICLICIPKFICIYTFNLS